MASTGMYAQSTPRAAAPASQPRLDALTGLRFIAAFAVVLYHYAPRLIAGEPLFLQNLIASGHISVSLFFVLSGLVLTYTYAGPAGSLTVSRRDFWIARFARIYPMYMLTAMLALPYLVFKFGGLHPTPAQASQEFGILLLTLTLLQAWVPGATSLNGPSWSVSAEAFFYLVFPFALGRLTRLKRLGAAGLIAALTVLNLVIPSLYVLLASGRGPTIWDHVSTYSPLVHLPEFLAGVCLGCWFIERRPVPRLLPRPIWVAAFMIGFIGLTADRIPDHLIARVLLPVMCLLVLSLATYQRAGSRDILIRTLSLRPLVILGDASYGLYLLQVPVMTLGAGAVYGVRAASARAFGPAFLVLIIAFMVLCSIAGFYWIETPARRWVRGVLTRPGPPLWKRAMDLICAALLIVLTTPFSIAAFLAIRATMGGPAIFRQLRAGYLGQPFHIFKFRTMNLATDPAGELLPDEQRLTALGAFLRRTSIDELPQLWNVLRGEMSLVGPRPLVVEYLPLYTGEQRLRHSVKPGITGLAQISGRNRLSWRDKFELDVAYAAHCTLAGDLRILAGTVAKVLQGSGVSGQNHATMDKFRGSEAE